MTIDPITIVFAVVAIFVGWRLWSVLGTRTGAERPPMSGPRAARVGGDIVDVTPTPAPPALPERWRGVAEPGSALARGLDAVAAGDPSFDAQHFLAGARSAYEMIINAFAAGDGEALGRLLAPEPLANFMRAIEARKAAGQRMIVTLVSIDGAEIVDAGVQNATAQVAVKFKAKMNSVTTDPSGKVVEGSATEVADHVDVWTFARPLAARDPNWLLAATEATH
jgi:predicted lipid-binding transport protein (Tim44 family)